MTNCNNGLNNHLVNNLIETKVAKETGDLKYLQDSMREFIAALSDLITGKYSDHFLEEYVGNLFTDYQSTLEKSLKIPQLKEEVTLALQRLSAQDKSVRQHTTQLSQLFGDVSKLENANLVLESVADLSTIENPVDAMRIYVKSYHTGLAKGGGYFTYDSTKAGVNDGGSVINGWVRDNVGGILDFGVRTGAGISVSEKEKNREAIKKSGLSGRLVFPADEIIEVDDTLIISNDVVIEGNNATLSFDKGHLHITGSIVSDNHSLTTGVVRGGNILETDADVQPHNLVSILNTKDNSLSQHRNYKAGQLLTVDSGTGSTFISKDPFVMDFASTTENSFNKVSIFDPVKVVVRDLNVVSKSTEDSTVVSQYAARFDYCTESIIENCSFQGGHYAGLRIDRSYQVKINNTKAINRGLATGSETSSLQYGLMLSDCTHIYVNGGYYYGTRHGVEMGGAGLGGCFDCIVKGATISSRGETQHEYSADFHGNTEECAYIDCDIKRGTCLSGRNNSIIGCRIGQATDSPCISLIEVIGGLFKVYGNTMIMSSAYDQNTVIRPTSSVVTSLFDEDYTIDLQDNSILCADSTRTFVMCYPNPSNLKNVDVSIIMRGNKFVGAVGLTFMIYTTDLSGSNTSPKFKRIEIHDMIHDSLDVASLSLYFGGSKFLNGTVVLVPNITKNISAVIPSGQSDTTITEVLPYNHGALPFNAITQVVTTPSLDDNGYSISVTSCTREKVNMRLYKADGSTTSSDEGVVFTLSSGGTYSYT